MKVNKNRILILVFLIAASHLASSCTSPKILTFESEQFAVDEGDEVQLEWTTEGADDRDKYEVVLKAGSTAETVQPSGLRSVTANPDILMYRLQIVERGDRSPVVERDIKFQIQPKPRISMLRISPQPCQYMDIVDIEWKVSNCDDCEISIPGVSSGLQKSGKLQYEALRDETLRLEVVKAGKLLNYKSADINLRDVEQEFMYNGLKIREPARTRDSKHIPLTNFKQSRNISEAAGPILAQISRIEQEAAGANLTRVRVFLHAIDSDGYFISGLTKRDICKPVLDSCSAELLAVSDFDIKEYSDGLGNLSIAIAMDHSGSMGNRRSEIIQGAAWDIYQNRSNGDDLTFIKFDHRVDTIPPPDMPLDRFIVGDRGYGGGTNLFDAIGLGLTQLASQPAKKQGILIVFTDGLGDGHLWTEEQLIAYALHYDIAICTIGFGDRIDVDLLRRLAGATNGVYQNIGSTESIKDIFPYIYYRLKKLYLLEYTLQQKYFGAHYVTVGFHRNGDCFKARNRYYPHVGNINFDSDRHVYKCDARGARATRYALDAAEAFIRLNPGKTLRVEGHTDSDSTAEYNVGLSKMRARTVQISLLMRGIEASSMNVDWFGETRLIKADYDESGNPLEEIQARNRRVELIPKRLNSFLTSEESMVTNR